MALKKTYAGYRKEDGSWEEQRDVDMHPLEEACIREHWKYHEIDLQIPRALEQHEEMELVLQGKGDEVTKKRKERQDIIDSLQPEVERLMKSNEELHKTWCDHVEHCLANGLDHDTHDKEKYDAT